MSFKYCASFYDSLNDEGKMVFMLGGPVNGRTPEYQVDWASNFFVGDAYKKRSEQLEKDKVGAAAVLDLTVPRQRDNQVSLLQLFPRVENGSSAADGTTNTTVTSGTTSSVAHTTAASATAAAGSSSSNTSSNATAAVTGSSSASNDSGDNSGGGCGAGNGGGHTNTRRLRQTGLRQFFNKVGGVVSTARMSCIQHNYDERSPGNGSGSNGRAATEDN